MAIIVPIGADTSGLVRGLNQGTTGLRRFGKIAAFVAGAAAVGGLVKTLQIGTAEFMQQQKVAAQTGAVLKSTGGIAKVSAKEITKLSESLMMKSGVDDEAIQSGQNLLLTFTKIRNETGAGNDVFNQATATLLDMSVALGTDVSGSAIQLGKALNDPIKGVTALTRVGVTFDDQQKKQIETMVKSGNIVGAQKIILAELTKEFGGSAEAAGKTLPGQLNILKQTFSNLAGDLVGSFLPKLTTVAQALVNFIRSFAAAPTLKAKVELLVGGIVSATGQAFRDLYTWWTTTQRTELPARVLITPSGQAQFDQFFTDLDKNARRKGVELGNKLADALINGFSSEGRAQAGDVITAITQGLFVNKAAFRYTGISAAFEFISGIVSTVASRLAKPLGNAILDALKTAVDNVVPGAGEAGGRIIGGIADYIAAKKGTARLSNVITKTVRDAIQSARSSLAGAASGLGGTLATILGANFTLPGGRNQAQITAEERKLQDERLALEEKRLTEAANAVDATEEDKLALREFYLDKEKTLRDRALQDEIDSRQKGIDALTESFNQGLISAETFATNLRSIIGTDFGTSLGTAFAAAFSRELQAVINTATDIAAVAGQSNPMTAGGGGVSDVLKAENQRRFDEALASWTKRRDARRQAATDFRKRAGSDGGSKITPAEQKEIEDIMSAWLGSNPKPARAAYGLAKGGILAQPTFVAGEAGKEAIIPLESGAAGKILRDALGSGGGSAQVINLTVNAGLGTNPDELSRVIVSSIKQFEKRNGSVFQAPLQTAAVNTAGKSDTTSAAGTYNRFKTLRSG